MASKSLLRVAQEKQTKCDRGTPRRLEVESNEKNWRNYANGICELKINEKNEKRRRGQASERTNTGGDREEREKKW